MLKQKRFCQDIMEKLLHHMDSHCLGKLCGLHTTDFLRYE